MEAALCMILDIFVLYRLYNKELTVEVTESFICELGNKSKRLSITSAHGASIPKFQFQGKDTLLVTCPS